MRTFHCTVAALVVTAAAARLAAGAPQQSAPATPSSFTVFLQGTPIGVEDVTVTRAADGMTISGTSRLGPPLNITIRRATIRYAPDGHPLECLLQGSRRDQLLALHTTVSDDVATTDVTEGTQTSRKSDRVAADTLLMPNHFFGSYEALAARLVDRKPGDEIGVYVPPQALIAVKVGSATPEIIRTLAGPVSVRRVSVQILNPGQPLDAEVWVDRNGRLVRLLVPAQSFDVARNDIVSVASRREPISHPGDEQVRVPANGFTLAGTLSKPASLAKGRRLPAVVLVAAGPSPTDRDETVGGVPVFGQLASALADAGCLVVRYDKRGMGQSGGRIENVTLADYAEDARAVVKFVRHRKDVDPKRVALVGYSEGGAAALEAARRDGDVRGLVLLGAPGGTGADVVLEQQRRALAGMNIPDVEKQEKIDFQRKLIQAVIYGKGWDGVSAAVKRQADTPWFQSWLTFDPARIVPKTDQPILIVEGALDREMDLAGARRLEQWARKRKGKAGAAVKLAEIPGVNHLLVKATSGDVDEYPALPDKTISSEVPAVIAGWVEALGRK